jgi:NDP-sugar pyrophosphorylase family protein
MWMVVLAAGAGSRLSQETGGRPKQLLEIAGRTLFDRLLDLGRRLDLAPLVITRPAFAACFQEAAPVAVLTTEETPDMLATLQLARQRVGADFLWLGGDTLLTDLAPLRTVLARHLAERPYASFLYRRSDRHLAKLALAPRPRALLTRAGSFPYSMPNFGIQSAASLADLAIEPRGDYVQRALDRGEPILFHEYAAPVFEIDTPEDLAAARRYLRCSTC